MWRWGSSSSSVGAGVGAGVVVIVVVVVDERCWEMKLWLLSRLIERGNKKLDHVIGATWKRFSHFAFPLSPDSGNVSVTQSESWGCLMVLCETQLWEHKCKFHGWPCGIRHWPFWKLAKQELEAGRSIGPSHQTLQSEPWNSLPGCLFFLYSRPWTQ